MNSDGLFEVDYPDADSMVFNIAMNGPTEIADGDTGWVTPDVVGPIWGYVSSMPSVGATVGTTNGAFTLATTKTGFTVVAQGTGFGLANGALVMMNTNSGTFVDVTFVSQICRTTSIVPE